MKNHTDLLNYIAEKIQAEMYLEIGVSNGSNFNKIQVEQKTGVDPDPKSKATYIMTSDEFFKHIQQGGDNSMAFDLIFIDGLHHADQVKKDILNAWDYLLMGGVIILHDCNPPYEKITHVPRDSKEWCGDVWKAAVNLAGGMMFTVNLDYGCIVLRKEGNDFIDFEETDYDWEFFDENRKALLNLYTIDQAIKRIDAWT